MLKKKITYTDFNNVKQEEEFYFNLTRAELTEMELTQKGGFEAYLQHIIDTEDGEEIAATFKKLILKAYGVKSEDGKYFVKDEEATKMFAASAAYSELFMELATDAGAAATWINSVIPQDLLAESNRKQNAKSN